MPIQRGAATPIKTQLVNDLRRRIASGDWPVGERMPSLRALATEYDVAAQTVTDAVAALHRAGLVQTVVGRGTYVLALPESESVAGDEDLRDALRDLRAEVAELRERVAAIEDHRV